MKSLLAKTLPPPVKAGMKTVLSSAGTAFETIPGKTRIFSANNRQTFFGYYDVTPFSMDDSLLLACQAPEENISPHDKNPLLDLGYYDLGADNPTFQKFGETRTWNWQQSCRLQWLSTTNTIIYNTIVDGAYGSVIEDISGKILKSFTQPIYSVSGDGRRALTFDFAKLHQYRPGYGYNNFTNTKTHDNIILLNLNDNSKKTIFTLDQAKSFRPHEDMREAQHYFNHLSFSPGSTRFMVTHLWITTQGKRRTRILIMDRDGANIFCPDNSGRTSHYCWLDDDHALIFHAIYGQSGHYILYNLLNGTEEIMAGGHFNTDGHPTLTNKIMLTDTYPNLFALQNLMVYNRVSQKSQTLARLHSPPQFTGELRCDLHPRLNHAGNRICIDALRGGRRAMLLLDLTPFLED